MRIIAIIFALSVSVFALADAAPAKPPFPVFVQSLKQRLEHDGFSAHLVNEAFEGVRYYHRTVYKSKHQPEVKLTLQGYLKHMMVPGRISAGYEYMQQHAALLKQVEARYHVQGKYVVALLGLESSYGRVEGHFPEISTLATLIYDSPRSTYFYKELRYALKIVQRGDVDFKDLKGSWAGAMGQPQFMPTHYYDYAVDFNHDGKKDIWHSTPDVLGSIAYSLHRYGWEYKKPIVMPVRFKSRVPYSLLGTRHHFPVAFWLQRGLVADQDVSAYKREQVSVVKLGDQFFMLFKNYSVLFAWNHSIYYVITVKHLANVISLPKAQVNAYLESNYHQSL